MITSLSRQGGRRYLQLSAVGAVGAMVLSFGGSGAAAAGGAGAGAAVYSSSTLKRGFNSSSRIGSVTSLGRHRVISTTPPTGGLVPTYFVEVELAGAGMGWTSLAADLRVSGGLTIHRGIDGSGPADLTAGSGVASFALDNSESIRGPLGRYSLYHANKRAGWGLGIGCVIRMIDPTDAAPYTQFVGRIDAIDPAPGVLRERLVRVTAVDWMDEAARFALTPEIGEQVGKRRDEILTAILAAMPRQPTATSIDIGNEAYPYALDTSASEGQSALTEFAKLAASEYGPIYVTADGTLRAESRHARLLDTTSDWTLGDAELVGLTMPSSRDEVINVVRVTFHPKIVDAEPTTVIYSQTNPIELAAGVPKFLLGSYRDPLTGDLIGATDVQQQIAGVDFIANASQDGSGADITADVVIVVTAGASGPRLLVTSSTAGYLTTNTLRGKGIYDQSSLQVVARDDASVQAIGEHAVVFDMPYQDDDDVALGAAQYLLSKFGTAFPQVQTSTVIGSTAALVSQLLTLDISDRLTISETVTGAASDFFINGIELSTLPTQHLMATYTLAPAEDPFSGLYWILETSVLGTDSIPAPF